MRILLIPGHGAGDRGAVSQYGREDEENRRMADLVMERLRPYADVVMYPRERNCYQDNKNGNLQVNFRDFDYVMEFHMNQSPADRQGIGNGVEIMVQEGVIGVSVEEKMAANLGALGFVIRRDQGIYRVNDLLNMNTCFALGVDYALAETCFIDNERDMEIYLANRENIADAYTAAVVEGFGLRRNEGTEYNSWVAAVIGASALNVRRAPNGEILKLDLTALPQITVIGERADSDGDIWYEVKIGAGVKGYVWPKYLVKV